MTPERIAELRALVAAGTTYAPLPWSGGGHSPETWIVAENQKIGGPRHVLEVRGWGYLTGQGHGGLGLDGDPAFQNQMDVRKLTVAAVNELGPLLDEVERLREAAEGALATMRRVTDEVLSDQANDPTGTMWVTVVRSCRELSVALARQALEDGQ